MGIWSDFKKFAIKGNVIDLAVGVIIGGAFGKIVSSLVEDLVMPVVAVLTGDGEKISSRFVVLRPAKPDETYTSLQQAKEAGANVLAYGNFIQTVVDFFIIAFAIFVAIRVFNKLQERHEAEQKDAPPPPPVSTTDKLLKEIRDLLKKDNA